ncbi:hypothetical protein HanIR_Chr04g0190551 [Helianthus annuus]|nr:hypothetical protein HanIR_Chr04g0190551 [Helianthus annuus]
MACPSEVAVPRPSSSNATSELWVADDCHSNINYLHKHQHPLLSINYSLHNYLSV